MTSQMVSLDNLVGLVRFFFGFFGFWGVNIPKVKNPGKCRDLKRKCKMLIQDWAGGISWGFRCKTQGGGHLVGFMG